MNLLVTAGNTLTLIDKVRGITNIFTGRTGAQVAGLAVLLELSFLNGRAKLPDLPVSALLTV